MAQLIVRNLEDDLVRKLKLRAAQHGCSMEAEHRAILRAVLSEEKPQRSLKQALLDMPDLGEDIDFARNPDSGRVIDL